MSSTVVGLFDPAADAQATATELKAANMSDANITYTTSAEGGSAPSGFSGLKGGLGSLPSTLVGMGVPDDHAHLYAEGVRRGGTLITADADDDEVSTVTRIMRKNHVIDIEKRSEVYRGEGFEQFDASAKPYAADEAKLHHEKHAAHRDELEVDDNGMPVKLEEAEEQLDIGKRQVKKGGVRIFRRVTETPVEKDVTLRDEKISVTRNKVDRAAGADAFKEGQLEVTETDEEAVVSKTARVTGEVVVDKTAVEHTEKVRDTVRKTEVEIEKDEGVTVDDKR